MVDGNLGLGEIQQEIIKRGASWTAAENPIWQLSPEEQLRRLGVISPSGAPTIEEIARKSHPHATSEKLSPKTPNKFDYRNVNGKNYLTPIRDQSACGSCVAFGCVASIEGTLSWQKKHNNPAIDLSEAQLFFCYGQPEGANCGSGWWPEKALPYCVNSGLVDEACFPYLPHDQACKLCPDWKTRLTKIKRFQKLSSSASMKDWISVKGPIIGAFIVYQDFFAYTAGVYKHLSGPQRGGHCVSIVGYDDTQHCWICKNSWNTGWGEAGFFRIEYGQCGIDSWCVLGVE